jgi:putative Mg2+ transporter-C (MgtC) family protein
MPTDAEIALRLAASLVLGGAIGLERELTGQVAGLRTHISVALGAALFGIVSAYSFTEFVQPRADTNYQIDVTRIASNVVTGVGFLGGGAILKHGASVRGLTTAASMWVTAAVGLSVGLGGYFAAGLSTLALIFALTVLRWPRRWLRRFALTKETVIIQLDPSADVGGIVSELESLSGLEVQSLTVRRNGDNGCVVQADVKGADLEARLAQLARREGVADVDVGG